MSAGFIQLAAIGQQDVYLTGSPQVTYFLGVYRRHTPFVLEAYDIPFLDQRVQYGQNNICRIPRKGDLVRGLTLKMTLPALQTTGTNWYWPIQPSFSNAATLYINGNTTSPIVGVTAGIDYYSTFNFSSWLNGSGAAGVFGPYVSYSAVANKFIFTGASNVWVLPYTNSTNEGVFWGLDPRYADGTTSVSGNTYLIYNISGSRTADFTLEQVGWLRNPGTGMPDPPARSGLFLELNQDVAVPTNGYLNFGTVSGVTPWTYWDQTANFSVTPGGRIHFNEGGLYIMRVGLGCDTGSVSNVAWGSNAIEDGPVPGGPTFTFSYPWRVAPNPSSPAVFPMIINSIAANVYVYAQSTGTKFTADSYVAINKADDFFIVNPPTGASGVSVPLIDNKISWYSNVTPTFSAFTSLASASPNTFKVNVLGPQILTGTLYLSSNYVSNVSLWEGANLVYTYDMSSQGRDPTFAFSIPYNVTDTSADYSINVAVSNTWSAPVTFPDVVPSGAGVTGAWTVLGTWGQFSMNASTETSSFESWRAFTPDGTWMAQTNLYSAAAPYYYIGPTYLTRDTSLFIYPGEWIQMVSPVPIRLTSVTITSISPKSAPGECVVFGNSVESNDGWTVLRSNTALTGTTDTLSITNAPAFRWIRVAFTRALNSSSPPGRPQVRVSLSGSGPNFILSNSYIIFNQVGVPADAVPGIVLPYSGLLLTANTTTFSSPLPLATDYTTYGNAFAVSNVTSSNTLQFSNTGTYLLTGALCTADQVRSLTVTEGASLQKIFPVSLGLRPPFTFSIPFHVSNVSNTFTISVNLNGATGPPNLFSNTFLAVMPLASNVNTPANYVYYDSVGTWAIQTAELKIGGQLIESLTGEFIELWNDLYVPYENQPALKLLTGKGDTTTASAARTYYINLPFYFFGYPELSIPLVSLDRQDLEVHMTFRTFSNLTAISSVTNPTLDATIITEYVYLSEPEINWFRSNKVEQIITQCQYESFNLPANFTSGRFILDLNNPIRELFFVIQNVGAQPYDYSGNGFESLGLLFNGYEALVPTTTDHIYTGSLEPFKHYPNFPTRDFYMYSFCQKPVSARPSGYINMSRIRQILLELNTGTSALSRQLRILAVNHNVLRFENGLAGLMFNS